MLANREPNVWILSEKSEKSSLIFYPRKKPTPRIPKLRKYADFSNRPEKIENRMWILYDAYNPYYAYISPTTTLPDQYELSFPLRDIPDTERQQPGREFWNGPQREGPGGAVTSLCPNGYLLKHPYRPA